jgi:kynurenine formamidase
MCDCNKVRGYGWRGWPTLPAPGRLTAIGDWIDLSHPASATMPRVPSFPAPVFELIRALPGDPLNVTRMEMVVHIGTHLDAPRHFFLDGPAQSEVPLDRLTGRAVIWPVAGRAGMLVEPQDLDPARALLRPGDMLFLNTGWHHRVGRTEYEDDHPALSERAAEWIVAQEVKLAGFDFPTPDMPVTRRGPEFDFPVHRILLSAGVLIAEHLTNLDPLSGTVVEAVCAGLNIVNGDGAPARIIARPAEDA